MDTDVHIDWLSFTLPTRVEPITPAELITTAKVQMRGLSDGHFSTIFEGQTFDRSTGRAPYRVAVVRDDRGCKLYGSSQTSTVLYELTGRGCDALHEPEFARTFIRPIVARLTRMDVAFDVACDTKPHDLLNGSIHSRFRSISQIHSDTGETVYVGSPKSDRFARIYRYNEPHPRSHLLRFEFVFRKWMARIAASDMLDTKSGTDFVRKCFLTWGIEEKDWFEEKNEVTKLSAHSVSKSDEETLMWLYKQVAPAMGRLWKSGALDITDFLERVYNG